MSLSETGNTPAEATGLEREIPVWDPLIRLFHWSLAGAVIFNLVNNEESLVHEYTGFAVLGLLAYRLIWGFIGPEHARFSNFVTGHRDVIAYLKGLLSGNSTHYQGHNPAGGWMVILMLVWLAITAGSGALLATDPFGGMGFIEGIHEAFAESLPAIIAIHLAGVLVSSLLHGENLVRAMINGRKKLQD